MPHPCSLFLTDVHMVHFYQNLRDILHSKSVIVSLAAR